MKNVDKKSILHYIPTFDCGGIETFFNELYPFIKDEYYIYLLVENPIKKNIKNELQKKGITILRVPNITRDGFIAHLKAIRKIFKNYTFDIVHIHDVNIRFFVMLQAAIRSVRIRIYHAHSLTEDKSSVKNIFKNIGLRINLLLSNTHFACSDEVARKKRIKKCVIINNGINIEKYKYDEILRLKVRKKYGIPEKQFIILFVGRVVKIKNVSFLIEVLKRLDGGSGSFGLLIVGDGDELKHLKKLNLRNVYFTGEQLDTTAFYSAGDVFCLPSLSEGFSIVLLEAQANGMPSIASIYVPQSVNVSKTIKYLGVDYTDIDRWVKIIARIQRRGAKRRDNTKSIIDNRFDSLSAFATVKEVYGVKDA